MDIFEKSLETIENLGVKESELESGAIDAAGFKPTGAPQGVYEQRDGLFMFRVRVPAGHLSAADLKAVAKIAKDSGASHVHFTTRQDVQLHGLKPGAFAKTGRALVTAGIPARGGGGNTFRNIVASPLSGLGGGSIFDVAPFATALSDCLLGVDKFFSLPRKYKIAVSDSASDDAGAAWHDLGLIATKDASGAPGFVVYGGGGLGREPRAAVKLLDFVPVSEIFKVAMAMGELFSDHGNREDRNAARIRFIVKKLGEDAFRKLFLEYYAKAQTPSWAKLPPVKAKAEGLSASGSFVKLPFKEGFIELERFEALAKLVEDLKQPFVRFAQDQSVYLPCVETKDVEGIFSKLGLPDPAPAPVSCIGAGLCKIGALDARAASARVRDALSSLQAPKKSVDAIAKAIRISGCLNCCSGHLVSPLGLQGQGKAGSGSFKLFVKGSCCDGSASIGVNEGSWLVPEDKVGEMVKSLAGAFLKSGAERFDKWLSANAGAVLAPWRKNA